MPHGFAPYWQDHHEAPIPLVATPLVLYWQDHREAPIPLVATPLAPYWQDHQDQKRKRRQVPCMCVTSMLFAEARWRHDGYHLANGTAPIAVHALWHACTCVGRLYCVYMCVLIGVSGHGGSMHACMAWHACIRGIAFSSIAMTCTHMLILDGLDWWLVNWGSHCHIVLGVGVGCGRRLEFAC